MTDSNLEQRLVAVVDQERAHWNALLAEVDPVRMNEPGVTGHWSFRDVTDHLFVWRDFRICLLEADARGEPAPPAPWPPALNGNDEINAWFHERDHHLTVEEVLQAYDTTFVRLRTVVMTLPGDALTDRDYFPWMGGQSVAESLLDRTWFDHLHAIHEPEIRRWLDAA